MDRYEVMTGKMMPLTDGAHRKWGFTGKVVTRSYERLVDALIDFVETGDSLKARFLTGFAACLAADRNLSRIVGSGSWSGKSGAIGARTARTGYLP